MHKRLKIEQLEYFGIPSYIINIWKEHYSSFLLPVQEDAVRRFHLLKSDSVYSPSGQKRESQGNLLVISPSSSGKTLVGEMAAMQEISLNKKVIYLVPLRLLAEEKYRHFLRLYRSIGLNVKLSSRDHRQDDEEIIRGDFHIAVMVYEKFYYLLLQYPQLLSDSALLIADEIQMINDPERGSCLENILIHLAINHPAIRIIALSAFTENASHLASWLDATVLYSTYRPVELRKGIVRKGVYYYVEHNTRITGKEIFFPAEDARECDLAGYLESTLDYLICQQETNLIFFPTRREVRTWSRWLSDRLNLPPARKTMDEFHTMEDSASKEELIRLLNHGIAYHCADLSCQERHFIEEAVRDNDIKIICATDTLSMGINLPVKNVILTGQKMISHRKTDKDPFIFSRRALTLSEVENMGGRAGRFSQRRDFGRIILLAPSLIELTAYQKLYFGHNLRKEIEPTQPFTGVKQNASCQVREENGMPLSAQYAADMPVRTEGDIFTFLLHRIALHCYTADMLQTFMQSEEERRKGFFWYHKFNRKISAKEVLAFLEKLNNEQLIQIDESQCCHITETGSLIVSKGISFQTYIHFKNWLNESNQNGISELEILFLIAHSQDAGNFFIPYPKKGSKSARQSQSRMNRWKEFLRMRMLNLIFEQEEDQKSLFRNDPELNPNDRSDLIRKSPLKNYLAIKKTLLMNDWISSRDLREIEEEYGLLSGAIQKMGEEFSWLADTLASIAVKMGWREFRTDHLEKIHQLSKRLISGVEPEGLSLAQLRIPGLTRGYIRILIREGHDSIECLRELNERHLATLLPLSLAHRIKKYLASDGETSLSPVENNREVPENHLSRHPAGRSGTSVPILTVNPDRPDRILFFQKSITANRIIFQLISLLAKNQGKMLSYEQIINALWPDDEDATYHRLWYHLGKLRNSMKKIIAEKDLSDSPDHYIREKVLKIFPGRGLLLKADILVEIKG